MNPLFLLFICLKSLSAAPSLDVTSMTAVQTALQGMAGNLMNYAKQGKVTPINSAGADGFQWFEGGLFYGIMMDYAKITQDNQYSNAVVNEMTKESFGTVGSFLGSDPSAAELGGKWNDDILWWSIPALTGAEVFGKSTMMPGGVTYFQLADNTYQQAYADNDKVCGGGIYWIRSKTRTGKNAYGQSYAYKSSITQSEAIMHAARLGALSGNQTYFSQADSIYKWMMSSGIVTSNFDVLDGVDADGGKCTPARLVLSYESGMAAGAFSWLSYVTKNTQYVSNAQSIFKQSLKTFVQNNIVYDPCEQGGSKCELNKATPKGSMVRGWGMLHEYTSDTATRAQIKQILQATVTQMLKTCDSNWNCGQDWLGGTTTGGYNVHYQMNAVELMNAYYKTFFSGPVGKGLSAPTQAGQAYQAPPPFGAAVSVGGVSWGVIAIAALSSFFL